MGLTTEHRGRGPKVVVPGTGQFLNLTCIRTNQSRTSIRYSAILTEGICRQHSTFFFEKFLFFPIVVGF